MLAVFGGLTKVNLSIGRVLTRHAKGGDTVDQRRLVDRFPRTQKAIAAALPLADASILVDNSAEESRAFTVARVQEGGSLLFEVRTGDSPRKRIAEGLAKVAPLD